MYSRNTCNTQCIKPIHKQRRNDFACKIDKCVDLWRNDVFYSKSMCRIVREYSLRKDYNLIGSRKKIRIKFAGNRGWVSINMLAIVRKVWFFDRFRTIEALFIIEWRTSYQKFLNKYFWKNVKIGGILFWKIAIHTRYLLWKNAKWQSKSGIWLKLHRPHFFT